MGKVEIRPATILDLPEIEQIAHAAYADAMMRISGMPDVTGGLAQNIAKDHVIVAVVGQRIDGFVVAVSGGDHLKLANLAVGPNAHGRGLARVLLSEVEKIARNAGLAKLRLVTHSEMPENIRLYTPAPELI